MADARTSLPAEVIEALRRGDKIGAVKLMRQASQFGLAEAKTAVENVLQGDTDTIRGMGDSGSAPPSASNAKAAAGIAAASHAVLSGSSRPGLSPGEVPRAAGSGAAIVILLAVAAFVGIAFLQGQG